MAWAETIRIKRLAALTLTPHTSIDADSNLCLRIYDAKWRIDHRDLANEDLLDQATRHLQIAVMPADGHQSAAA